MGMITTATKGSSADTEETQIEWARYTSPNPLDPQVTYLTMFLIFRRLIINYLSILFSHAVTGDYSSPVLSDSGRPFLPNNPPPPPAPPYHPKPLPLPHWLTLLTDPSSIPHVRCIVGGPAKQPGHLMIKTRRD